MWEKSVANDDNECCNDDNEDCDPMIVDRSTDKVHNQNRVSRERLAVNLYNQDNYQHTHINVAKFSNIQRRDDEKIDDNDNCKGQPYQQQCSPFYCSQNGFFNENNDLPCANLSQMCNIQDDINQCNFHNSLIKPSNTYPIIKDLNKLRSMSLPSMAVASNQEENKNENYNLNEANKFDKKFDEDGDNPGGGYSNNENNYSFSNLCNHNECNQSSSHRFVTNNYLNERGISNSNTNDPCTEREYAIRESVSNLSSKNSPMSKFFTNKIQPSDTCSQINVNIQSKVISYPKSDSHNQPDYEIDMEVNKVKVNEIEEEEVEEDEIEEEEEEDEEEEDEEEAEDEEEEGTGQENDAINFKHKNSVEINGNKINDHNGSLIQVNSIQDRTNTSTSKSAPSKPSVSYAPNGNIRSRAHIILKPCDTNDDLVSLSKSSSGSYYYTTTTVSYSSTSSNSHIRPILKASSAQKMSNSNSCPDPEASSFISNRRRTSANYSSRNTLYNNHLLNNIPVLSFPKVDDNSLSQDHEEVDVLIVGKKSHNNIYTPMSQSSSDSSSSCSSSNSSCSRGNHQQDNPNKNMTHTKLVRSSAAAAVGSTELTNNRQVVVPITPPITPPPLVEIISNRRRRFFVK